MKLPVKISIIAFIVSIFFILFIFDNIQNKLILSKKDRIIESYKKDLYNLKEKTDLMLNEGKNTLSTIAITTTNKNFIKKNLKYRFEFYMKNIPEISSIKYIPIDGQELVSVSKKKLFNEIDKNSYLNKDIFRITLQDDFFVSDIYYTKDDNEMMIDMGRKVTDINNDNTIGVMIIKISMSSIQEMISDKLIDVDAIVLLDTNTNSFLYRSSNAQKIDDNLFLSSKLDITNIDTNDVKYLMVSSDYNNEQLNMKFFLLTKENNLFIDINKTLQENLLLLILTIIISSIIMFLIVSNMLKPLKIGKSD